MCSYFHILQYLVFQEEAAYTQPISLAISVIIMVCYHHKCIKVQIE